MGLYVLSEKDVRLAKIMRVSCLFVQKISDLHSSGAFPPSTKEIVIVEAATAIRTSFQSSWWTLLTKLSIELFRTSKPPGLSTAIDPNILINFHFPEPLTSSIYSLMTLPGSHHLLGLFRGGWKGIWGRNGPSYKLFIETAGSRFHVWILGISIVKATFRSRVLDFKKIITFCNNQTLISYLL